MRKDHTAPLRYSCLVYLDDLYTGLLQIEYLLANGKRELIARHGAWLVVTDKRPVENRDGPREHPFHGLFGKRLGIRNPFHGHRPGAADVAEQDRRLDAP
jgi:hypothetical protein